MSKFVITTGPPGTGNLVVFSHCRLPVAVLPADGLSLEDYNIEEGNRLHLFVLKTAEDAALAWDQMRKFLLSQFSPEDAEKVLEEYKKASRLFSS